MSNTNYIYGDLQAAYSGGTIFSGGTPLELIFAGANDGYQSVNHSQLVSFVSTSALTEGSLYLINDYKTIYIQPDYLDEDTAKTITSGMTKEGVVEPIVVVATSDHTLSKDAWSTTFPNDKIEYDHRVQNLVAGVDTKGKITRRVDAVNNDISYDFRNVKFKRYQPSTEPFVGEALLYWDNGGATSEHYVFKFQDLQQDSYQERITNNRISYQFDWWFDGIGLFDARQFDIWAPNTTLLTGEGFSNNKFDGYIINGEVYNDEPATSNVFNGAFHNFIIGGFRMLNNEFNITAKKFRIISNTLLYNTFQGFMDETYFETGSVDHNTFKGTFYDFTVTGVTACINNKFDVQQAAGFAVVNSVFTNNTVDSRIFGNSTANPKVIYTQFNNNKISSEFFKGNQIDIFANNNLSCSSFEDNSGYGMRYCNFPRLTFRDNTFSGTTPAVVSVVDVDAQVTGTDFTNSTFVYINDLQKNIFYNGAGNPRLSYFDENDALNVTDITD